MAARFGKTSKPTYIRASQIRRALAALRLPDGMTKPYRPVPADFREVYIRMGWDGIDEHFNTNWRVIRRWIELSGRADLIAARATYVEEQRAIRRARRRIAA